MDWWEERDLVLSPADSESAAKLSESSSPEGTDSPLKVTTSGPAEEGKKAGEITARIGCLPCQHTSNRGLHDRSSTLWSSWSVESGGKKLYFAGWVTLFCLSSLNFFLFERGCCRGVPLPAWLVGESRRVWLSQISALIAVSRQSRIAQALLIRNQGSTRVANAGRQGTV